MRILFLLLMFTIVMGCNKEDNKTTTKLDLVLELRYDGSPVSGPQRWYAINDSVEMQFSKVSFYLSDFKLENESESLDMVDVLHVSFLQNTSGDVVRETEQTLRFEVPSGDYSSLSFGLGLTAAQNATLPANHEAGSAMSLTSEYWPAWQSYIFTKIEGNFKLHDSSPGASTLHTGGNDTYRILEWNDGLSFRGGEVREIIIPIDLKEILKDYPLTEAPRLHQLEQLPYMNTIADGFLESMVN